MTTPLQRIHHDGSALYVSNAAPELGDSVTLRLRVPRELAPDHVVLRTVTDGEPRIVKAVAGAIDGADQWWTAELPIRNPLMHYRWMLFGGNAGYVWLNAAGVFDHDISDSHDFRISAFPANPAWAHHTVVYQIFPDRFASSGRSYALPEWAVPRSWDQHPEGRSKNTPKEYFGGDLWGVIEKLDYLQDLGVTTLYFTPIFPAGSTHRYDASTFDEVDPLLGGNEALIALTEAAHKRGMRVFGDLTLNHSGDTHEWFVAAQRGDEATRDFYTFNAALEHGYESWLGVKSLPKLNYRSHRLIERLISGPHSVVRKWLQPPFNLDGWRIDVANMTGRQGEVELNHEIARVTRQAVADEGDDKVLVAEHFHDAGPDLPGDGWQAAMNYSAFMKPVWAWLRADSFTGDWLGIPTAIPQITGRQMVDTVRSFSARMPWRSWVASWTILSSHDTARIRTVVGSRERHAAAAIMLVTTPGVPMIFAGDELGAEGRWGEDARTPHPWHTESEWDHEFLSQYKALIRLRSTSNALAVGGMRWVHIEDDAVVYLRETADERCLIAVARNQVASLSIDAAAFGITSLEHAFGFDATIKSGRIEISAPTAGGGIWRVR